jgi:hypothetical protein
MSHACYGRIGQAIYYGQSNYQLVELKKYGTPCRN